MLPLLVKWNFERMVAEDLLSEREQSFFTDKRLVKFWKKVGGYLSDVKADWRDSAASMLVGDFINPISFGYGMTGTKEQPMRKTRIREAQKKADPVISRIAQLAGELAKTLDELEKITATHPCEVRLLSLVRQLIHNDAVPNISGYWLGVRTADALRIVEQKFNDYPETKDLFQDVPGMASQKATWADWMREAENNLVITLRTYPGNLTLTESDWVNLAKVLCGEHISRSAVQAARRSCNPQPE
ncbi:MAG: hypothetical protein COZ77_07180 [Gallionellales bacterium CG_4_8_14_3_um_filter_54_18]|nr:MAG: hypothetical protein COZ77_07180 [Gallionellales bacterium CG_4_8_14_3_um_filter_54_18]PIY01080.1 MAG: hypothetical protein COZ23_05030 [Hydrogenophilales bacterium CG_4_10_14_3_um_filter_58_23]PJB06339.1 MAG: hypothetical protein CO125_07255 [Hydrogenophilales bacterium CG_4_9_14_3_um_filter_59_35]